MSTPGLVVDETVVIAGRVPAAAKVRELLESLTSRRTRGEWVPSHTTRRTTLRRRPAGAPAVIFHAIPNMSGTDRAFPACCRRGLWSRRAGCALVDVTACTEEQVPDLMAAVGTVA
jgi:hypothetical protein